MSDADVAVVLTRYGIVYPYRTIRAAREAGLGLPLACALLDQESDGGHNVFGHDPTIFAGAGRVTKDKYLAYRKQRVATGLMQGVGPTQLTWYGFQDEADKLGGCWRPYVNMFVGFRLLKRLTTAYGIREGVARYNGSGPYDGYANTVLARLATWKSRLA